MKKWTTPYKGDLKVGMKVKGTNGDDHYHGVVRHVLRKDYAGVKRSDGEEGTYGYDNPFRIPERCHDLWIVERKEDGSWASDCDQGRLTVEVTVDSSLPWEP